MTEAEGALAPKLTKWDLRVLRALSPEPGFGDWSLESWRDVPKLSAWQVAEAVREEDVAYVRSTLAGLQDRGYVRKTGGWERHKYRWLRSREGQVYLDEEAA